MSFNFGENLRKIRLQRGLTQKEVGRMMGITEQGYAHFERLEKTPRNTSVERLAAALDVSPEIIHGGVMSFDSAVDLMLHLRKTETGSALDRFSPAELIAAAIDGYESGKWTHPDVLSQILLAAYHLNPKGRQRAIEMMELLNRIQDYNRESDDSNDK